jgi:predicted permease
MSAVIEVVLPVFLIIALGAVLCRAGWFGSEFLGGLNRLAYTVGLPALLFDNVSRATYGGGRALIVCSVVLGALALATLLGLGTARALRLPAPAWGTFLQATFRGNLAFVGLPIIALALARRGGPDEAELRTVALLTLAPVVALLSVVSVPVLVASQERSGPSLWRPLLVQLFANPLILACAAGGLFAVLQWRLPAGLDPAVRITGQMALPIALLCIGGALVTTPLRGRRRAVAAASILKVAVAPAIGYPLSRLAGLDDAETLIALVFLACPAAAASYTVAVKLGGDVALAAGSIVVGTLLSALTLSAVLALTG